MSASRTTNLRNSLTELQEAEVISSFYSYAPGDVGRRWSINGPGVDKSLSTREAEVWVSGVRTGLDAKGRKS